MSILCVLACVYWSQLARSARRTRLDSDIDEGQDSSKGRSPSHQRTQSMNDKFINSGDPSQLTHRKLGQSINTNGVHE